MSTSMVMFPDTSKAGPPGGDSRVHPSTPRPAAADNALKIEQSIAYMLHHLSEPLQVSRLASLINVSPSHYFTLFKRRIGCAPIDYFIRLRMRRACELLGATSLNVKEVAASLGYDDPFYFSRMFKAVTSIAPTEYRTLGRDRQGAIREAALPGPYAAHLTSALRESVSQTALESDATRPGAAAGAVRPRSESTTRPTARIVHGKRSIVHSTRKDFCPC